MILPPKALPLYYRVVYAITLCVFIVVILCALIPLPPAKPYSTLIQDRNGKFLQAFLADDGVWRLQTSGDEIPEKLKRILIEKEDRFFYFHPGVNPFAIGRAFLQNIVNGKKVSGASTLTMQVARMLERRDRTYFNKCVEIFRAFQLELRYSKDQILEMYLSMVPLGGNIEGLQTAALMYYQTPLERLNIAQVFDLILIPNSPNQLRPDKNGAALLTERKRRAEPWITRGLFTREDSVILWQTPAAAERRELPRLAPHFCLRVKERSANDIKIRTTLDLNIQEQTERLLKKHLSLWKSQGLYNGAVLIIENRSRQVVAYMGSEDFNDSLNQGQCDVVKAVRSPGSTLKPFLYACMMEQGLLTPKTMLIDVPYDEEGFTPDNYNGSYSGLVTAESALRRSLNVPMVRLLKQIGVPAFTDYLIRCRFSSIDRQKEKLGLSLIVGGCGVTLEELTSAYTALANGGRWAALRYTAQDRRPVDERWICSSSTAFMITEILAGLNRPDLPNNFESSKTFPKVAFKTGTSYGRRDAWSFGYSAEYTVGIWMGNVTNRGHSNLTARKTTVPLLFDIFNAISKPNQKMILPQPGDILIRKVCALSGKLPGPYCRHTVDDYFSFSQSSNTVCDLEKEYMVSEDGTKSYCASCVGAHASQRVSIPDYPSELIGYWVENGVTVSQPPPHNSECARLFTGDGPKIFSPSNEETYYLTSEHQKIPLQANAGIDVHALAWYYDEDFIGTNKADEKLFVEMRGGAHKITCRDDKGRRSSVTFEVKKAL